MKTFRDLWTRSWQTKVEGWAVGHLDNLAELARNRCDICNQPAYFIISSPDGAQKRACHDCASELITAEHPLTGKRAFPGWTFIDFIERPRRLDSKKQAHRRRDHDDTDAT